jgi:tetratricopeptide (TPR) repeat protein
VVLILACVQAGSAQSFEEVIRTNQTGRYLAGGGQVLHRQAQAESPARSGQFLDFGDALRTLDLSWAAVRFTDWSQFRLKDRTRLEIERRRDLTNAPGLRIPEGQIYITSRGGPRAVPIQTPHVQGVPKGTEFLVSVDAQANRTEVTMFDGEVELQNALGSVVVPSGWQGVAEAGQPPRLRAKIEARSLVQWWIYYPGILPEEDLSLAAADQTALAASLAAYREGDLLDALAKFPGHPTPADPSSDSARTYLAGLLLTVGAVDRAEGQLNRLAQTNAPPARALRTMIAAVSGRLAAPEDQAAFSAKLGMTASELLALSYAHQSTNNLAAALAAARTAAAHWTNFGLGWARLAELEFSFGHTRAARAAVARALALTPRNAQAHALNGFLLAAENRNREALAAFDRAIEIDPALGNAWLGRGLCKRRLGIFARGERTASQSQIANRKSQIEDWVSDLQTAAILEPRRSLLRSYAGKAFSEIGNAHLAATEFDYAKQLDPNDPTPWLYSALENYQENRVNEAARDLSRSIDLNDNRAVYRSRLLLDQDRAVRSASLAKIYQSAGLDDVALREAAKAVSDDYASHSAHQFLAESYNALRDPTRFNLRYETVWFNELLLANILSPAGAGLLSQNISQQEYSRFFEANRLGFLSSTEVRSDGQYREVASHYGLLGRTAYTLDLDYQHNNGIRPNNDLERIEWYAQIKRQLTPRDSLFVLSKFQDYESGDNFQHYDPATASRTLRVEESQAPIALAALHREWRPGLHTTLLAGRLHSDVEQRDGTAVLDLWTNSPPPGLNGGRVQTFESLDTGTQFTAYLVELNQVWQSERHLSVLGGRFQAGAFNTGSIISDTNTFAQNYYAPPVRSEIDGPFHRWSFYGYHTWELWPRVRLTAGLAYDRVRYPENFRFAPLSGRSETRERLSPKAALHWGVHPRVSVRGIYAQSVGGLSYDESVRLEPVQLAGFSQSFRSVVSEAEAGSVVAPRFEVGGLAVDVQLPGDTFLGVQGQWLHSDVEQTIGVFKSTGALAPPPQATPAATRERLRYDEPSLAVSLHRLFGEEWSAGAGYELTRSRLRWAYPEIPTALAVSPDRAEEALLHRITLRVQYQHAAGFFARAQARWFIQHNDGYVPARRDDSVAQFDVWLGWRIWRRRAEVTVGCLIATGEDYRLNSLTPYPDLPRERVWMGRVRWEF